MKLLWRRFSPATVIRISLIVDEARKWRANVIVLGTHCRRGMRHAVLGGDAEAVVHGFHAPVLLVRRARGEKIITSDETTKKACIAASLC